MKYLVLSFLLAATAYAGPITQKPLDELVIYDLPVAQKTGTTTIMFPSEISGLYAKSLSTQEQENAGFLIAFTPGNFYFTIQPLISTFSFVIERTAGPFISVQAGFLSPSFNGAFAFDLTELNYEAGVSWNIVTPASGIGANYGAIFGLIDFDETSTGLWLSNNGSLQFNETKAVLSAIASVPEPSSTTLNVLMRLAHQRWTIEQDYQQLKEELSLDHFEGRSWRGLHHHLALCFMAFYFLNRIHHSKKYRSLPEVRRWLIEALTLPGCPLCLTCFSRSGTVLDTS